MKTNESNEAIKLNSTFMRLSTGASTISSVIAQRSTLRARLQANQAGNSTAATEAEESDPFSPNFCR